MSRIMFVLRYRNGEPEPLDLGLVREVLEPYAVAIGPDLRDGVLIRTADGHEAGVDVNEFCLAVSRFPPGRFFAVLAELVDRLGASMTLMDRPVLLREEADRAHLPEGTQQDAVVVAMTGRAVEHHVTGSRPTPR
ncbi:hypothetical protein [Streptomyces xanthophaeus]|uniref:hypothetical protein n=1 Tax=Streptomyces xanthophaeus TaxID=67385 RepID=UPI00366250BF